MTQTSEKLEHIKNLLRLLDVDIERCINPSLSNATYNPVTHQLGEHMYVLSYTTDIRAALSLPGANAQLGSALEIVIDWLRRNEV